MIFCLHSRTACSGDIPIAAELYSGAFVIYSTKKCVLQMAQLGLPVFTLLSLCTRCVGFTIDHLILLTTWISCFFQIPRLAGINSTHKAPNPLGRARQYEKQWSKETDRRFKWGGWAGSRPKRRLRSPGSYHFISFHYTLTAICRGPMIDSSSLISVNLRIRFTLIHSPWDWCR